MRIIIMRIFSNRMFKDYLPNDHHVHSPYASVPSGAKISTIASEPK